MMMKKKKVPLASSWLGQFHIWGSYSQRHTDILLRCCPRTVWPLLSLHPRHANSLLSPPPSLLFVAALHTQCHYEQGSDGQMLHYLSSPQIASFKPLDSSWTVTGILDLIARWLRHASLHFSTCHARLHAGMYAWSSACVRM